MLTHVVCVAGRGRILTVIKSETTTTTTIKIRPSGLRDGTSPLTSVPSMLPSAMDNSHTKAKHEPELINTHTKVRG